jgi:hypothetical protein
MSCVPPSDVLGCSSAPAACHGQTSVRFDLALPALSPMNSRTRKSKGTQADLPAACVMGMRAKNFRPSRFGAGTGLLTGDLPPAKQDCKPLPLAHCAHQTPTFIKSEQIQASKKANRQNADQKLPRADRVHLRPSRGRLGHKMPFFQGILFFGGTAAPAGFFETTRPIPDDYFSSADVSSTGTVWGSPGASIIIARTPNWWTSIPPSCPVRARTRQAPR